jgi:uncharacterized protein (TIRG00374 family)
MAKGKKRKLLFLVVRVVVTVGLLGFIYTKIEFRDKVFLKSGDVLEGKLVEWDDERVVIVVQGESEPRLIAAEDVALRGGEVRVDPGLITVVTRSNKGLLAVSFALMALPPTIGALRWQVLLRTQGVHLSFGKAAKLSFIGQFFNNFLIGLTGGDLMKAYLVTKETHHKAKGALSVFVDRVVGMLALAVIAAAFMTVNLGRKEIRAAAVFVYLFLGVLLVFVMIVSSAHFRKLFHIQKLLRFVPLKKLVEEVEEALVQYRNNKGAVVAAVLISLVAQSILVLVNYGVGRALGIRGLGLVQYFALVPMIVIISAIPISLAGWGWGETQYTFFFGSVGVPGTQAIALSVAVRLFMAGWSLLGAGFYVFGSNRRNGRTD